MHLCIYSDVHGNLPAFETMLEHAGACDGYICLGDLVNYGPWSNECVDLACSLKNSFNILGNHEEAFLNGHYPGENKLVQSFFNKTYPGFNKKKEIGSFLLSKEVGAYTCCHTILDQYIYPDTTVELDKNYIVGHSHHQFKYLFENRVLYNAGSVGQNRKYINACNYLLYDTETEAVSMEQVNYPFSKLINEMRSRNYPAECIEYYEQKAML